MKCLTTVLLVCCCSFLQAQIELDTKNVIISNCNADPDIEIFEYENWEIYQTDNNEWDGNRLDACISLREAFLFGTLHWGIDLQTIDASKPVFCRFKTENATNGILNIDRNSFVNIYASIRNFDDDFINVSDSCANHLCSGLITVLEYAQGVDSGRRRTDFNLKENFGGHIFSCYFSEKTALNRYRELIYKVSFKEQTWDEEVLHLSDIGIEPGFFAEPNVIDQEEILITENFFNGETANISLYELSDGWSENWVLTHNAPGFPSFDNQSISYLNPEINSSEPKVFNLFIEDWHTYHTQAHSHLKGGFLEGSDSLHHELNIFNESLGECLVLIERIFEDNTNLISKGGDYIFSSPTACLQFRNNSKFIVDENATLNFAPDGTGILNLRSGGTVELKTNAKLNFNGLLMLNTFDRYKGDQDIFIEVPNGTEIRFGPKARIKHKYAPIKLNFVMKGGFVDTRYLSNESKALINFIYPDKPQLRADEIIVSPNPSSNILTVQIDESFDSGKLIVHNLNGQVIKTSNWNCLESNVCQMDISALPAGSYFLTLTAIGKTLRTKFIKIDQ